MTALYIYSSIDIYTYVTLLYIYLIFNEFFMVQGTVVWNHCVFWQVGMGLSLQLTHLEKKVLLSKYVLCTLRHSVGVWLLRCPWTVRSSLWYFPIKNTGMGFLFSFFRRSPWVRNKSVPCISRQILYHWAAWDAHFECKNDQRYFHDLWF